MSKILKTKEETLFEEHVGRLALLHSARQRVAENRAKRKELMDTFFAEHAEFFDGMDVADDVLNRITEEVRQEAMVLYKTIPNLDKTAIPGITIRGNKVVTFLPEYALVWAIDHRIALQLDERAYKKLVLAGQAPGTVETAHTAAIATDLSEFAI